ncbi:MAG: RsmD family RNA methyltransferase [Longimicrobiales bacterium]|nr:RsmD family RNA methyltransferase [Longimicrobiales bacterium]
MRIIAGEWRGRRLVELPDDRIRPTIDRVREAWFSAMGGRLDARRVLDLFAGTGALGLESLSRGAEHVTFVERHPHALEVIRENLSRVGADPTRFTVVDTDALAWIDALAPSEPLADLALADPPWEGGWHEELVRRWDRSAFAGALWVEHPSSRPLASRFVHRSRSYGGAAVTTLLPPPDRAS